MRLPRLYVLLTGLLVFVVLAAAPGLASNPPASDLTVPTTAGQVVTAEWTGTAPPGSNNGSCAAGPLSDGHDLNLGVPAGTYDAVRVQATLEVTYSGPSDLKITIQKPDGTMQDADAGFIDADETAGLTNPEAGAYKILVCSFAGATPQAYAATLTLEASANEPGFATGPTCVTPSANLKFETDYIDTTRAGGEPIVTTHPDGTLLWGSHAGTTHFFGPAAPNPQTAAFLQNYRGQTYQYFSEDGGATWQFASRLPINGATAGLPNSGFSDPEFAIDSAGNVFISEINLVNVAVSKSTDSGRTYQLQNLLSLTQSDRQWMEADEEDVLYITANGFGGGSFPSEPLGNLDHFMAKSTDGGRTFTAAETPNPNGVQDLQVDRSDGTIYEISADPNGTLGVAAFRNIRSQASGFADGMEISTVAEGVGYGAISRLIDPTIDIDSAGNLYIVWRENGDGARPAGIYFSYSTDRARSWADPVRVDPDENTDIWPWLAVGDPGEVAVTYLTVGKQLENEDAELAGPDDGWNVVVAQTENAVGCGESRIPGFTLTQASPEPVHFGTICQGGTVCQAELVDRRLGDYFANEITRDGNVYISVGDTRRGGSVALPRVIRQVGGPSFLDEGPSAPPSPVVTPGDDVRRVGGETRLETAVGISQAAFDRSDNVVLARVDDFPDALAAGGLATELDAPVLLTPTEGLDGLVADELERLGVRQAYLAGGPAALSEQVETDLEAAGIESTRLGGEERFETAALVAREIAEVGGPIGEAIVALGGGRTAKDDWPDALASASLSGETRAPIVLVSPEEVPDVTADVLGELLDQGDRVYIAGGTAAVGDGAQRALDDAGYRTERLAGGDRYGTAVAVVEEARRRGADAEPTLLVTGTVFADALVGGPAAHRLDGVALLVHPERVDDSAATRDFLSGNRAEIDTVFIAGGPATISEDVATQVRELVRDE